MIGDQQDMLWRMKQVLPLRWFPDDTPVLDTVLSGVAWAWTWVYALLQTVKDQTRISTASGMWLDLIAADYFGTSLCRRSGETDNAYRSRIQEELIRDRGTREAVVSALTDLTGRAPALFEPTNTLDTGGYGGTGETVTGLAYGYAGGWGDLYLPFQFFVTAYRPVGVGIAFVTGWCCGGGGYGAGALEYGSLSMIQTQVTDGDILSAITGVLPIGVIAWTNISS